MSGMSGAVFKKNDLMTVKIEDMSNEGEGIGKADGFTLFVKDAVIGDTVECKLVKVKKNYAYARLEKVLVPSADRVEPVCPTYRQCGGCQLQALSYERQLAFKQQKVRGHLIRIGGFGEELIDACMEPIVGMEAGDCKDADAAENAAADRKMPLRYRNKAQYPVGTDREGRIITGFYAGRTHSIIPNIDCSLGTPENERILRVILQYMRENKVSAYDETTGQGLVRHILIRKGFMSGQIMVCLVINRRRDRENTEWLPAQEKLIQKLTEIPGMASISVSINIDDTNVIMGKEIHTLWGGDTISDTIRVRDMQKKGFPFTGQGLTFHISPLSFYQVNPAQTEKLYSLALEYAGLTGKEIVWDLYCGIGTISLFLAKRAGKVYGVEIVPQAIEDAKENARRNGIDNAEFLVGKAEEILPEFYERHTKEAKKEEFDTKNLDMTDSNVGNSMCHPDVIVVDPPRKGCDSACLETMLRMRPERIVYVSCDSATLARDLRILCDGGYELKRVRPTDMFPNTVHCETVVLLSNRKPPDTHVRFSLNMEDYYRIKEQSKNNQ